MNDFGEHFSASELFVPQMLMAAQTMKVGLAILNPLLSSGQSSSKVTVVIETVKGGLNDIGKKLVAMMLKGSMFDVVDLGVNMEGETFIKTEVDQKTDEIALSASLTTTMPSMKTTVKAVRGRRTSWLGDNPRCLHTMIDPLKSGLKMASQFQQQIVHLVESADNDSKIFTCFLMIEQFNCFVMKKTRWAQCLIFGR